jgi:serine/threonine-protein phosphatase 2A activator
MDNSPPVPLTSRSQYVVPQKCINNQEDFEQWKKSKVYAIFTKFILDLSESVKGKKNSDPCTVSPVSCFITVTMYVTCTKITTSLLGVLEQMSRWVDEIPPTTQPTRFGNKAFRTWYTKVESEAVSLLQGVLPDEYKGAAIELAPYLVGSIGNYQRIDYGTGHEASFVAFLCCLNELKLVTPTDYQALVTHVFNRFHQCTFFGTNIKKGTYI